MTEMDNLNKKGTRVLVFSEYVPVTKSTRSLAPTDKERLILEENVEELKETFVNNNKNIFSIKIRRTHNEN